MVRGKVDSASDSANVRIEFFDVADNMLNDDIEKFLAEHYISLNSVSWMAAPIDYVSVILHDISIDKKTGEEVHSLRPAKLKNFSVYDSVQEVKHREQVELTNAFRLHGKQVDDGHEWHFEGECPIIAAYDYGEPCDVVILSVRVNRYGKLTIIGDEKNDRGNEHEIKADDIFAGQMSFITSEIGV